MARRKRPGRSRRTVTLGLLVLASITIITLDYRGGGQDLTNALKRGAHDTFAPIQRGVNAVVRPIGSFLAGAVHYGSLEQQNAKMRQEIGSLQQQVLQTQSARQTAATLTRLDNLPWVGSISTVTAQVVGLNTSNFASTVQLDVGSKRPGLNSGGAFREHVRRSERRRLRKAVVRELHLSRNTRPLSRRGTVDERIAQRVVPCEHPGGSDQVLLLDAHIDTGRSERRTCRRSFGAAIRGRDVVAALAR
jgi:hypothetical protein